MMNLDWVIRTKHNRAKVDGEGCGELSTALQLKAPLFSLLYLLFSLLLAVNIAFSTTKSIRRSSLLDPIQVPLFSYPSSYGEHKHAIPTTRSSCNSPVLFSDYSVVLEEMRTRLVNFTGPSLRYMQRNADSFGGNLDLQKRLSYFDHHDGRVEIPCGFFREFPVSDSDKILMEKCNGVVVVSAIFNDHDKIRQPKGIGSETLNHVCFIMFADDATLERLHSQSLISRRLKDLKIGAWRIIKVDSEYLYDNAAMNGEIPKYLLHRLFPNSKYSIWIDAKLQLVVDPLLLIHSLVVKGDVDMAISKHPFFVHTIEEAMATARWKKWWDVDGLKIQMETYCENGLQPWSSDKSYPTDVPDNALILQKHTLASNLFSCLLFNELEAFNPRDQLPFAYVRDKMNPELNLNMFDVEVFEQVAIEYRHNLKPNKPSLDTPKSKVASSNLFGNGTSLKCDGHLKKMWDVS